MSTLPFEKTLPAETLGKDILTYISVDDIPKTARAPDVRVIAVNTLAVPVVFKNPAAYSAEIEPISPGEAAMIMPAGDTLEEQYTNARALVSKLNVAEEGLGPVVAALRMKDPESVHIAQAYGPAPFEGQAKRLETLNWMNADGSGITIEPEKNSVYAIGARKPAEETVVLLRLPIDSKITALQGIADEKGARTNAERFAQISDEYKAIVLGIEPISKDGKPTGEFFFRPIAIDTAQKFYGDGFNQMPVMRLDTHGRLSFLQLKPQEPTAETAFGYETIDY